MDAFCGSRFWDSETVWNTDDPDFTVCFEKTVLVWVPCAFLWIFLPLEIYLLRRSKASDFDIPWNTYNVTKLVAIAILAVVSLTDIVIKVFFNSSYFPVDLYSSLIKIATFVLFFGLTHANVRYGRRSSAILFLFSLLLFISGVFQCRTEMRLKWLQDVHFDTVELLCRVIYYPLVLVVFLMNCFADPSPQISPRSIDKNACPRKRSSFLSRMLFTWFDSMIWKGYKKKLEDEDLWTLDCSISSSGIVPKFEKQLNKSFEEIRKIDDLSAEKKSKAKYNMDRKKIEKVSVVKTIYRTFGFTIVMGTLLRLFVEVFAFVNPQILSLLIDFVGSDESTWKGYTYVALFFLVAFLQTLLRSQHVYIMDTIALRIRACLISTIYQKALRISNNARRNFAVGDTVNLMTVDANQLSAFLPYSYLLFSTPLQVVLTAYFLWQIIGPSALAGFGVIVFLIVLNVCVAIEMKSLQLNQMEKKDERIKLMNQILSGIKMLKLNAWEPSFEKRIQSIRNEELKMQKKQAFLSSFSTFAWTFSCFLVYATTFTVYVLSNGKNVLTAKVAFVSLSLFNILELPLFMTPMVISSLVKTIVSMKRIDEFLNSENLNLDDVTHERRCEALVIENGSFSWDGPKGSVVLRGIDLKIYPGTLVAVVGPVGSGKSSLVSAFLGEMYKFSGVVNTRGSIAYVPQQAWIQNATLRDNITFGTSMKKTFYDRVLEACALKPDLEILVGGDSTEIGERGINLSGGQKQRISLARAVYYDADTYFLDDPLSAVDSQVGKHIFEHVIGPNGLLKDKTRVLVTHNITYLSQVDFIVVLKNGTVSESGSFRELLHNSEDFSKFFMSYLNKNQERDEEDWNRFKEILEEEKLVSELPMKKESMNGESEWVTSHKRSLPIDEPEESLKKRNDVKENIIGEKLTEVERTETGNIKWQVYKYYLRSAGFVLTFTVIFSNFIIQTLSLVSSTWLSQWTSDTNATYPDGTQVTEKRDHYLTVYAILGISKGGIDLIAEIAVRLGCWKSAKILHDFMLKMTFRAPLSFMDVTPAGRIISRFSKDVDVLDNTLPDQISDFIFCLSQVLSILFIISFSTPVVIVVFVPLIAIYCFTQRFYITTSRQLKRLESVSRSPIYSHFLETIVGAQSIRAYGLSNKFIEQSEGKVDFNHKSFYLNIVSNRWLSVRTETIGNVVVFFAAFFAVLGRENLSPGLVGLSVSYALQITNILNWLVVMTSEVETNAVAVERIKEFSETPQEAAWEKQNESLPQKWPLKGDIDFQSLQIRYRTGLELILKGISFHIEGGKKVGIVGRTGAGKSSLTLSLFRIIESDGGKIMIDGVDIATLGLHTLRSRLTIVPQDPVLFCGSLRMNLDPVGEYSDESIWRALELAHLKSQIVDEKEGLQCEVTEGGENFSVGQRQLICLARALLRKTKILIMDEATAAIDLETDDLIQSTIRSEFKDCTVLTIAHRLNTIMDYDKIIVLDKGALVEYDSPQVLLESNKSLFYRMAADAGLV